MFGGLLRTRLKAAELALQDGLLDKAFRLAHSDDLSDQSRAQQVLMQCCEQLFERAEEHVKAGRYTEAMLDLDRAAVGSPKPQRIEDLRSIVRAALEDQSRQDQSRHRRLDAAADRMARGSIRAAEKILEQTDQNDPDAERLRHLAQDRLQRGQQLFAEVQEYIQDEHWAHAVGRFKEARRLDPKSKQGAQWEAVLLDKISGSIYALLRQGRLQRAFEEMRLLSGIGENQPGKKELLGIMNAIAEARRMTAAADYVQARQQISCLRRALPEAAWVQQAGEQVQEIGELCAQLAGGPLGSLHPQDWIGFSPEPGLGNIEPRAVRLEETIAAGPACAASPSLLPEALLILIDGAGSYLLFRKNRASIGRASSLRPADIPLIADLSEHHADIARVEDDYFVLAHRDVNVGGHDVRQKLLQHGDRIVLARRAKLEFKLPSRRCASAVLDLSESAKMPHDVRRIVLFDRFAMIGKNPHCHMVVHSAETELLLFERGGRLRLRPLASHSQGDEGAALEIGRRLEIHGVGLVIQPWKVVSKI